MLPLSVATVATTSRRTPKSLMMAAVRHRWVRFAGPARRADRRIDLLSLRLSASAEWPPIDCYCLVG
jgi:hypothetical protein